MKKNNLLSLSCIAISASLLLFACNSADKKKDEPATKKDTVADVKPAAPKTETKRPPIINITDTLSVKHLVLAMKDSAASMERIGKKLGEIYDVKLADVIKKNKLKITGQPIAWYKSEKAPYFFEAGLPVDKKPSKLPANVFVKEIGIDSVVVAHFYGSYDLLPQAYEALSDWMKDHKKTPNGKPYEIYVDDPLEKDGKLKDPYKVQTDIVFPWK